MASGNTLVTIAPAANEPPTSNPALFDIRNSHVRLKFDAAVDQSAIFSCILPRSYSGGGLTVTPIWSAATATSGNVVWNAQIERLEDEGTDTDSDSFASAQTATGAAPGTSGALQYTSIAFTSGAQMDSLAAGEMFRLKITRDADHASDSMVGFAELAGVEIKET